MQHYFEPAPGLFIAESPKVIEIALAKGYEAISFLMERKHIEGDAKKIRYELSKVIRARTVPELHFFLDDSMEYGDKMDKLFKSISKGENRD